MSGSHRKLVILGGPGDGFVVAEAALKAQEAGASYTVAGFLNDASQEGTTLFGLPVLGRFEDWSRLSEDFGFCPAVQKVGDMPRRVRRIEGLGIPSARWITVQHPTSSVARDAFVGNGCFIASFVTVQPAVRIDNFASIRAGASLGHHATIEPHAYVGPNSTLCGGCCLMFGAHLGPNAVVLDKKRVGRYAVVGIGSAVTKDVRDFAVVMGNPARPIGVVRDREAQQETSHKESNDVTA